MIDKFIPALICITVFVLLGVAVCRVGARADRRMAAENSELQPIGYESAQVDALEEFKARKAEFVAAAMKAERERLLAEHNHGAPLKPASEVRGQITLLLTKEQRKEWGL
jgi:cobalamin biosynthesis protein CobD/CbiB